MKTIAMLMTACVMFLDVAVGQTWQLAGTLTQGDIRSVLGTSWGYVFAGKAGPPGGLMMSTDNGQSWTQVGGGRIDQVNTLAAKLTDTIFAGLSIFGVARSTDNGYNWSTVGLVETEVFALGISREQNVFAGTWLEGVYRSSNNGENWVNANLGLPQCHPWNCPVKSFAFDSSGTIFACPQGAGGAGIYYSTNNGDLWLPFPSPAAVVQSLAVHSSGSLFAGSHNGIYRSTNNGSTWTQDTVGNVTSISINNSGHIFAGTLGNGVFRSTDVGNTWLPVNSGLTNLNIQCITVTPQGFVFVGTNGAGVFRTVESTNSTPENNWTIPNEYILKQNYPNPFNPMTTIEYELPSAATVRITVFDVLGRILSVLEDKHQHAGKHVVHFDATGTPSGVLFYQLKAGAFTQTKRMMVIR
jgi:photosystem II stability/assembly factor-like uncharacterized protein